MQPGASDNNEAINQTTPSHINEISKEETSFHDSTKSKPKDKVVPELAISPSGTGIVTAGKGSEMLNILVNDSFSTNKSGKIKKGGKKKKGAGKEKV